jgi:hypothetical protein
MSDGEREIDIPVTGDSDENPRDTRQGAGRGAPDSSAASDEQRGTASTPDGQRINVDDLDPSMRASRNQDYGEVM